MACIAEQSVVNTDDDGECSNSLDEEKPMAALSAAEMPIGSVLRPVQPTNVLFGGARLCGGHKSLGAQRAGVVVPCVALGLTKAFRPYIHASGSCYAIALRHIIR